MSNEVKAVSFRLAEEDVQKFREFAEEQGLNQAEMFQGLMNNFEMARAKGALPDRAKEIETFQDTVNTLIGMFTNSLAVNQTSEERIRETFGNELNSKDKTITDLQEREGVLKAQLEIAHKELDKCTEQLHRALISCEKQNKDITQKDEAIANYQSQISMLNETVSECRRFKDGYKAIESENAALSKKLTAATNENSTLLSQNKNLEDMKNFYILQIDSLRDEVKAEKEQARGYEVELGKMRLSHAEEISTLKAEIEVKYKAEFEEKLEFEKAKFALELTRATHREQVLQEKCQALETKVKTSNNKSAKDPKAAK